MKVICVAIFALVLSVNQGQSLPQSQNQNPNQNRPQGILGLFNQWWSGLSNGAGAVSDGFFAGTATGAQALASGAQNITNGFINGFNQTAGGAINGFETVATG